jgi:PIN domain nuclease of toxin-antitoxin system
MYLLDTHALIWSISAPEKLSRKARRIVESGAVKASVVSYWELILKRSSPRALVTEPVTWWEQFVNRSAVEVLPLRVAHITELDGLTQLHRDPFDRVLLAQAIAENLSLLSRDSELGRYGAKVVWD